MRIVVTGGAGFIGSHLVDGLLERGHAVWVVDDLSSGRRDNVSAEATLIEADIRGRDAHLALGEVAPEVIFHLAAQMDVRKSVADPRFDVDVNLGGLVNVLEGGRAGGALRRVVFASSGGAMYGEQDVFPAPEDHPVRPESPYGLAKAVGEQYLALYERLYGIRWTALRYANVYGPRQTPDGEAGVVAIFCWRLLSGEPLLIFGDGEQTRDYVFVDDVVQANLRALDAGIDGGFNVGTGVETSVNRLVELLRGIAGTDARIDPRPARPGEQRRSAIDASALERACGFRPRAALADGLATTFAWFASLHQNRRT